MNTILLLVYIQIVVSLENDKITELCKVFGFSNSCPLIEPQSDQMGLIKDFLKSDKYIKCGTFVKSAIIRYSPHNIGK